MLVPMADLINHYSYESCTTEVCHLKLEQEQNKDVREEMEYRKLRGNYDMNMLLPDTYFDPGDRKSNALHFVESFSGKIHQYKRLTENEEQEMAFNTAEDLMKTHEDIDIWEIPNWIPNYEEDNDTSDSEKEEEPDSEDAFFDQIDQLKHKVASKPIKKEEIISEKVFDEDDYQKIRKESEKKRTQVMNFVPGPTQKPSHMDREYKEDLKSDIIKVDLLDQSESHSDHQESYPWFSTKDENVSLE